MASLSEQQEKPETTELNNSQGPEMEGSESPKWISGWRLVVIALGTSLALFMVQTESSITSTAIAAITNDLGGFDKSTWVFTAYLLTYSGFPVFFSKVSDIFGRKQVLLVCIIHFVIFSAACGAAQTLLQLIMFRWLKGIGASGIVALGVLYGFELRPPEKWAGYSAIITLAIAISIAIAPIIGAAFVQAGQWRWCFLLNVPIGASTAIVLFFTMPNKLQLEPAARLRETSSGLRRLDYVRRLDFVGVFLLVGASVLLMTSLHQAAEERTFVSPKVLPLLILSPFFLAAFLAWEWVVTAGSYEMEPIFPWSLVVNRVFMAMLANSWLSGMVLVVTVVQIPQRFMIVNGLTAINAGVRLLPFVAVVAFTSVFVAIIVSRAKIPPVYTLIFGALLQVAGAAGLSRASTQSGIEASQYGFQVLAGAGVGIYNIILILLTPYVIDKKHLAIANGAVTQFRILGGSIGLSIVTCATSQSLRANLMRMLSPGQTSLILDRTDKILTLPADTQMVVRGYFGDMYNVQMIILIGISAAELIFVALQWQRETIIFKT
ncbi:MFS general substrate transporter [Xylaria scruposa]|nr:MFS general substrate transporter [Xylaria scruposa]